jgi:hypothetical protein
MCMCVCVVSLSIVFPFWFVGRVFPKAGVEVKTGLSFFLFVAFVLAHQRFCERRTRMKIDSTKVLWVSENGNTESGKKVARTLWKKEK